MTDPAATPPTMRKPRFTRRRLLLLAGAYALLLIASHLVQRFVAVCEIPIEWTGRQSVELPVTTRDGVLADRVMTTAFIERGSRESGLTPVILLHGSPGDASNFIYTRRAGDPEFLELVAAGGRWAIALDLPGFGGSDRWVPDYSNRAHAHSVLAFLDAMGIERAHIVGWSNGGGVGLHMAKLAPDRVASLTMLAAIGAQEVEGSGDYWFEHGKYAVGYGALVVAPELIPHFGLLCGRGFRHAFIRNFWDSDQRPLRGIMSRLDTPTLILHGRDDFLVPSWGAELHHELIATSRLVMLDASHFIPWEQTEEAVVELTAHFTRHDEPGIAALTGYDDRKPMVERGGVIGLIDQGLEKVRWWPWWVSALIVVVLARLRPEVATAFAGIVIASVSLDFGVATVGLTIGRALMPGDGFRPKRGGWGWVRLFAWALLSLAIARIVFGPLAWMAAERWGIAGLIAVFVVSGLTLATLRVAWTWTGRRRIIASLTRVSRIEYWPTWVLYVLIGPNFVYQVIRTRHPLAFTACNPGMPNGGGVIGESKASIDRAMPELGDRRLALVLIEADAMPQARADQAKELLATHPELGGLPVILKPDAGERGHGVRLVRTQSDIDEYFQTELEPVVMQRYHPGPGECGVFWIRHPKTLAEPVSDGLEGFVFAITRKTFPVLIGDGKRTFERLIMAHPRHRCQADVFLRRFADRRHEVLGDGEVIRLAQAGNHAQGTLFTDGTDLITPELTEAIDAIARNVARDDPSKAGGFDFGRFDLRYESDEQLRRGEGFAIIELNGVTSEATNLYDPGKTSVWSILVLWRQWSHSYTLGAARMGLGREALGLMGMLRVLGGRRRGSSLGD